MMETLRELAKAPAAIFGRVLGELQRIARERVPADPKAIEEARALQTAGVREIAEALQDFRTRVGEAEATLGGLLRPRRANLPEEVQRAAQHLIHLLERLARRDRMLQTWEDQPPEAMVVAYRRALDGHELETVELFEAEAERVLRRKGHPTALRAFLALRARAEARRLTPAQRQAQADLEEIERLKREVGLATLVVASTLKVPKGFPVLGACWRQRHRVRLEPEEQGRTAVTILPGPHRAMKASVVDVTREGLCLALPEALPPGTVLHFTVQYAEGPAEEALMQGEVRWCRADTDTSGRALAGVRLVLNGGDQWLALLTRHADRQSNGGPVPETPAP